MKILENTIALVSSRAKERSNGQSALFDVPSSRASEPSDGQSQEMEIEEFPPDELLKMEKDMLGLYISDHPLTYLRDVLETEAPNKTTDISQMREGDPVIVGGMLTGCRKITTRKNDLMMVATLEDLHGTIAVVFFPKTYEKYSGLLRDDNVVIVKGRINRDTRTDDFNVAADIVENLGESERVRTLHVKIEGPTQELLHSLKEVLLLHKGGELVYMHVDGKVIAVGRALGVTISPALISHVESLVGQGSVSIEFEQVSAKEAERVSF